MFRSKSHDTVVTAGVVGVVGVLILILVVGLVGRWMLFVACGGQKKKRRKGEREKRKMRKCCDGGGGGSILTGYGPPDVALGKKGQLYLDLNSLCLYGPKTHRRGWPMPGTSLVGPSGKGIRYGLGPPSNSTTGVDGDFYIDVAASMLYGPKAGGVWPPPVSLVGDMGASILNGVGPPQPQTGRPGDFYIDRSTTTLYGPKSLTSSAWTGASVVSLVGPQGIQGIQGIQGPAGQSAVGLGAVCVVDQTNGNDSLATRGGIIPFKTITAAMAAAEAGDTVSVLPGGYAEMITIKNWVSLRGIDRSSVGISLKNPASGTVAVTMGEGSSLHEFTVSVDANVNGSFTGILFPGTTAATATVRECNILMDNSTAPLTAASTVLGIHSIGTGVASTTQLAVQYSTINVVASGVLSTAAALLVSTAANTMNVVDTALVCTAAAGASGTFFGAQTNVAACSLTLRGWATTLSGTTADISQTQGSIVLQSAQLANSNANGLPFTGRSSRWQEWGDTGQLATGTQYFKFGSGPASGNETVARIIEPAVLRAISVQWRTTTARIDTLTVRKNGVDTSMVLTTSSTNGGIFEGTSVSFAKGDTISVRNVASGTTTQGGQDTQILLAFY